MYRGDAQPSSDAQPHGVAQPTRASTVSTSEPDVLTQLLQMQKDQMQQQADQQASMWREMQSMRAEANAMQMRSEARRAMQEEAHEREKQSMQAELASMQEAAKALQQAMPEHNVQSEINHVDSSVDLFGEQQLCAAPPQERAPEQPTPTNWRSSTWCHRRTR